MKILSLTFLILFSFTSLAIEVNLGAEDSWPPHSNSDGIGISTNIVKAAFAEVGVVTKVSPYPYARAVQMVMAGELDGCYNVAKQELTQKKLYFGTQPILSARAYFFHHSDNKFNFTSIQDIPKDTSLVAIRGYDYGDMFEKYKHRLKVFYVNNQEQLISMLLKKRVSIGIMYDEVAKYHLRSHKRANEVVRSVESHTIDVFVAFNLESKKSKVLASKLDEGILKLKASGKYKELLKY